jgi:hypothetical protein
LPAAPEVTTPPGAEDTPSKLPPPASAAAGADADVAAMALDAPAGEAAPAGAKGRAKGGAKAKPAAASEWGDKLEAAHRVFLEEKTSRRMYRLCAPAVRCCGPHSRGLSRPRLLMRACF